MDRVQDGSVSLVDSTIETAQKLGSLAPAAIFALVALGEGWYIRQVQKDSASSNERWRETREKQIVAEVSHTEAIQQMSQKLSSLEMAFMKYLINKGA